MEKFGFHLFELFRTSQDTLKEAECAMKFTILIQMESLSTPPTQQQRTPRPFIGYVATTVDALRLVIAARAGYLPRITRRLNDAERRSMIHSGSVFVFCTEECGIHRWTEGLAWTPSRIGRHRSVTGCLLFASILTLRIQDGNFLSYREVTSPIERNSYRASMASGSLTSTTEVSSSPHVRNEVGQIKPGGLIKRTITIKVDNADSHVISYFREEDIQSGHLQRPCYSRRDIASVIIPLSTVHQTKFRHPPRISMGPNNMATIHDDEETVMENRNDPSRSSSSPQTGSSNRDRPHAVDASHALTLQRSPPTYNRNPSGLAAARDDRSDWPSHQPTSNSSSHRRRSSTLSHYASAQQNPDYAIERPSRHTPSLLAQQSTHADDLQPGFVYLEAQHDQGHQQSSYQPIRIGTDSGSSSRYTSVGYDAPHSRDDYRAPGVDAYRTTQSQAVWAPPPQRHGTSTSSYSAYNEALQGTGQYYQSADEWSGRQ
ncbi:uncharacterized protein STEHIDRAFT_114040 [Stereum hirsutum FP-91666 SS1]|uniref:uncharacterized protein n=1 Tax=Stereum hirsutum (strain FP-91666) TaxID=721885 RepID=UPI000444A6FB|nr:uncharacterized protein STEHIDRAFT_114040 [Stereum hirsutum FP-91666 SS1]EIM82987.1 hypothetical protein STEHIDRAFT_114040 [Stereum hirsutum FP-91666 SS1]